MILSRGFKYLLKIYTSLPSLSEGTLIYTSISCKYNRDIKTLIFSFFRSPPYNENNSEMEMGDIDLSFIDVRDILNLDANFQPMNQHPTNGIDPIQAPQGYNPHQL